MISELPFVVNHFQAAPFKKSTLLFTHLQIDGDTDRQIRYPQLLRMCKNAASGLARLGVKKHDVMGIFSPNTPEYPIVYLAASAAGATITAINSTYTVCK